MYEAKTPGAAKTVCAVTGCQSEQRGRDIVDALTNAADAGWGLLDDGSLICGSCVARIERMLAIRANAHLN